MVAGDAATGPHYHHRGAHPHQHHMGWRGAASAGVVAATSVPLLISLAVLCGRAWVPAGDESVILFQTARVGGRSTPLVGAYSTRGWAHPGPILYYLLAPGYRLFGSHPVSLFQSAVLVNVLSLALLGWLLHRRRGVAGVCIGFAFAATLIHGMRPELFVQAWNPYVPVLLYVSFLVACWSLLEGDLHLLALSCVLAGVLVQMHVAYLPMVGFASVVVAATMVRRNRAGVPGFDLTRHHLIRAVIIGSVIWVPPLWDAAFGHHDLLRVGKFFLTGTEHSVGFGTGLGLLSGHVGLHGPWSGGHERLVFANVVPEGLAPLAVVAALLLLAAAVHRKVAGTWPAAPVVAGTQLVAGALAAARLEEPVLSYLLAWMLPLAAFCWFAIAVTGFDAMVAARSTLAVRPALRWGSGLLAATLLVTQTVQTAAMAGEPPLPRTEHAAAVESILRQVDHHALGRARIEAVGDDFNEAWVGVVYGLSRRGVPFWTSDGAAGLKWGSDHVWFGQKVDTHLTIATYLPSRFDDVIDVCRHTPWVHQIASWDQLTHRERDELRGLQIDNWVHGGRLWPTARRRFDDLSSRAWRIAVFAGPGQCGGAPS
jgi:hypothetical protein